MDLSFQISVRKVRVRLVIVFLACLSSIITPAGKVFAVSADSDEVNNTLILFNWPDYMPEVLLEEFKMLYGIEVRIHSYLSDENKQQLLARTGGTGLDLIIGSGASMREYIAPGWIQSLNLAGLPGLTSIDDKWMEFVPELRGYAVPMLWGTLGIAYRTDLVPTPPTSWQEFFNPDPGLRNRVMLVDDSADCFGAAQKALGLPINPRSREMLDAAYRVLSEYRHNVYQFSYPRLNHTSELLTGSIYMAMVYSGDGQTLQSIDKRIGYVHPSDGTNLWVDYIAVAKHSKHPDDAHRFIEFLLSPKRAAILAESLNYGSTVTGVEQYVSTEHLNNPIIYPPRPVIDNAEVYRQVAPELLRHRNQLFLELKK